MKRKTKKLLKKNNIREKNIDKKNKELYTDMVVYLRGSSTAMYNQELVREDIIEMIIEGQKRGEDIQKVIGENYKYVCDEIIHALPKKTREEKFKDIMDTTLSSIWILGIISIIKTIIYKLVSGEKNWDFTISIGDILNIIIITVIANVIVNYICKNVFENEEKSKVRQFLKNWVVTMVVMGVIVLNAVVLDNVIINTSISLSIIIVGVIFILERMLSLNLE